MAILATIVGLLTTLYVFIYNAGDVDDKNFEKNLKISLAKAIATVTIMYVVANCVVYNWTGNSKISEREKDTTLAEATASYGLKSDTEYPFDLGNRITGTVGSTTTRGGYFVLMHLLVLVTSFESIGWLHSQRKKLYLRDSNVSYNFYSV